jgi:hypothetical protein
VNALANFFQKSFFLCYLLSLNESFFQFSHQVYFLLWYSIKVLSY